VSNISNTHLNASLTEPFRSQLYPGKGVCVTRAIKCHWVCAFCFHLNCVANFQIDYDCVACSNIVRGSVAVQRCNQAAIGEDLKKKSSGTVRCSIDLKLKIAFTSTSENPFGYICQCVVACDDL